MNCQIRLSFFLPFFDLPPSFPCLNFLTDWTHLEHEVHLLFAFVRSHLRSKGPIIFQAFVLTVRIMPQTFSNWLRARKLLPVRKLAGSMLFTINTANLLRKRRWSDENWILKELFYRVASFSAEMDLDEFIFPKTSSRNGVLSFACLRSYHTYLS